MRQPLLEVTGLKTQFGKGATAVQAVNDISFVVDKGTIVGIVGESGSGKSVTALSIMRLIEAPGRITDGQVVFHDDDKPRDLLKLAPSQMEDVRGNQISMIFQDPMTSLNPVLSIGYQIMEPLRIHRGMSAAAAATYAAELLERVGIPDARRRLKDFPHQFSGGMRQRVMIAIAVACNPMLLIADEPTTALDVTIQAQILDLLAEVKRELGTSVMIITHDLGVVAEIADRVTVMYAGIIAETGPVAEIFRSPQHPYTRALMASIPRLHNWPARLPTIEGAPPLLTNDIVGCPFAPRCPYRIDRCTSERPPLLPVGPDSFLSLLGCAPREASGCLSHCCKLAIW